MIDRWCGVGFFRAWLTAFQIATTLSVPLALASVVTGQTPGEYSVKAAFLLNFARYTEWPATAFSSSTTPLVLCIVGDDPFGQVLDTVEGKPVRGRPIRIERNMAAAGMRSCHIAFISDSERS